MIYPSEYIRDLSQNKYDFIDKHIEGDMHVIFTGNTGSGKTYLADIIYRYVFDKLKDEPWFSGEWIDASAIYRKYLDKLHTAPEDRARKIDMCLCATLSVLDDLGSESNTEASRQFMATIICSQHESILDRVCRKSIITTNLTLEEIATRYGARTYSRLTEHYTIFVFDGEDKRHKNNKMFYQM